MNKKIKPVIFIASLVFNAVFFSSIIASFFNKKAFLYYYYPGGGAVTAAAVVNVPASRRVIFEQITLRLKPGEKATMQFAILTNDSQANALYNALYDPKIISVEQTGYGLEITAVAEGETLMQHFINDGIHNLALIIVEK